MEKEASKINVLLGVGNPMRGDDGIGPHAADIMGALDPPGWVAINAETVPENFTGVIRKLKPGTLVIVDAADMGLEPGEARRIPPGRVGVMHFSTHAIPMPVFIRQMGECAEEIILLGIQVDIAGTELGTGISDDARMWAEGVIRRLAAEGPRSFRSL